MTSNLFSENPKYIEFPQWDWPNHSRRPKYDDFYIPAVPPYQPYVNDKPLNQNLADWFKKDKEFTQTKDTLKFRLELAGFAKEEVSVTIGEGKYINVNSKNGQKPLNKVFTIPNAENYNLVNPAAQMANGLLEISFAAKKEEVRAIKIL